MVVQVHGGPRKSNAEVHSMQLVHESRPQVRKDRLLRLPEVEQASGLKKSTVYLLMKRGEFPRCVQVTPRCVAWPESAVLQWVQDRISQASAMPAQAQLTGAAQ
jgi:prophage regulatory protein